MTAVASTGDVLPLGTPYNFNWQSAANGQVMIATCSYRGYDGAELPYVVASGEDCGGICAATSKCTHFIWRGNRCVLKAPGATNTTALSSADPVTGINAGKCGYVVSRKPVVSWTTESQFKVASNCTFTTTGVAYTTSPSDVGKCKTSCLEDPSKCNYFKVASGSCIMMKADSSMNPIPISSSQSTCGYLSRSVTIAPNGPALKAAPPVKTATVIDDSKYQVTSNCNFKMTDGTYSVMSTERLEKCKSYCQIESCLYFSFSAPNCILWKPSEIGEMSHISATDSVCGQDATVTIETASSIDDSKYQVTSNCNFIMPDGGSLASDKQTDLATCKSYCTSDSCLYFTFSATDCTMLTPTNGKIALIPATDSVCGQIATSEQSSDVINLMSSGDQVQSTPDCSFKPPTSGVTINTLRTDKMTAIMCQYYCIAKSCNYFTFTSSDKRCQMLTTSRKLVQNPTKGSTCGRIIPASTSG